MEIAKFLPYQLFYVPMPTYVYRREDGSTFEIEQRITAEPLTEDPETGQPVKRIISGSAGLIFKGSGFYHTDYVRKNSDKSETKSEKTDKDSSKSTDATSDEASKAKKSTKADTGSSDNVSSRT